MSPGESDKQYREAEQWKRGKQIRVQFQEKFWFSNEYYLYSNNIDKIYLYKIL